MRNTKKKLYCEKCDYSTIRNSQYQRHLLTTKHKLLTAPKYTLNMCVCGKTYTHLTSLYAHKQICKKIEKKKSLKEDNEKKNNVKEQEPGTIVELIKQNQDFKSLLIEQQRENQKLQKQLIEAVRTGTVINNTTNNNQKFNLNFFLNTTCKDAMNMTDFINAIEIEFKDIENIGKQGYVLGMTDMILSRIKDLDITKRPLHCTDIKRETMYIKDNDEWSKDTLENNKLRNMINIVAKENYSTLPLWMKEYPECDKVDNPRYNLCLDMMRNLLGDVGDEQTRMDSKIIKNISSHIVIDKN